MFAVWKREFKACFQNVIGWLFVAAVLALFGLYFYVYSIRSGYPYVSYSLSAVTFIMMIAVPILTMRSLSEERRNKTDQLTLTAPVSLGKIVLGKYLAMLSVFTIDVLFIAATPLLLSGYGEVPFGECYVAILGFWLYGGACIAVGTLISSLTESQVIAAVLSFACLFLGYMMSSICSIISESGNLLTIILGCFDLYTPLANLMNGCLDIGSVVYFLTIIAVSLFLTCQVIQKRRWSISVKKIGTGVFSMSMIAVALAAAVMVNLLVAELPSTITSIDATSTKLYSITDDTKDYLKELTEDVAIYVLSSEEDADEIVNQTLQRYEDLSEHITVEYKNPTTNPTFYKTYTDTTPTMNSLIVVGAERSKVIDYYDIYEYSYDYTTYSTVLEGYDAEGQITSAIQYVTMDSSELPKIYEITGHGEVALSGSFLEALVKANITTEELTLLKEDEVLEDAAMIIINAPTSDFSSDDVQKVIDYIERGGNVMITCNFEYQGLANFESILAEYGMSRVTGLVMENDRNYIYGGTPYYLLPDVSYTDYSSTASGGYIFAPYSQAVAYGEATDTISYTELLVTSDKAVSKTNVATAITSELEEGDVAGPFAVAVAMEKVIDNETTARVVVVGSDTLFTDSASEIVSGNNVNMFTDTVATLVGETELSLSVIESKPYTMSNLTVTAADGLLFGLSIMLFIPLALLITGISIWVVRRKK